MATLEVFVATPPEATALTPWGITRDQDPTLAVRVRRARPSAVAASAFLGRSLGFEALTSYDFSLRSEVLSTFILASLLLKSKEIELSLAWRPSEEVVARLEVGD